MTLIQVKDLAKRFPVQRQYIWQNKKWFTAVEQINLTIERGENVGLIGESGSGKSTLGRIIVRLLDPSEGRLYFDGEDITSLDHRSMIPVYRKMQFIFQDNASSLNSRKPIGEQIVGAMLRLGVADSRLHAEQSAVRMLEKVGLKSEHFYRYPHEFSGGQQQRIGIARALAVKPIFLVLDEPTSGLDVSIQAQILNLLLDLQDELKLTYLFIGHNLTIVEFFCNRLAVMEQGKIVELLDRSDLYGSAVHTATKNLVHSILPIGTNKI